MVIALHAHPLLHTLQYSITGRVAAASLPLTAARHATTVPFIVTGRVAVAPPYLQLWQCYWRALRELLGTSSSVQNVAEYAHAGALHPSGAHRPNAAPKYCAVHVSVSQGATQ